MPLTGSRFGINTQGPGLSVQMGTLHADCLGQFAHASAGFTPLVCKVVTFELLAGFAQGQIEDFRMLRSTGSLCAGVFTQCIFNIIDRNFTFTTQDQQTPHQVAQLAQVARPAVIAQPVLGRD